MASPAVAATTEGALSSAAANVPVTLPASGGASDGYLVIIAKGSVSVTVNALTDWAEALDEAAATGLAVLWYTGAGVPSNPTFVQSGSSRSAWAAYRITGCDRATTPTVGTTATGSSTTPDPPSATVTAGPKDILAVAVFSRGGEIADDDSLVSAFPTNYTDGQVEKSAGTAGTNLAGIIGAAARQVSAASSENPGTFTAATGAWRAQTIIVYPSTATNWSQPVNDSAAGTDAQAKVSTSPKADTIAGTDAQSRVWAAVKPLTETPSATDALSQTVTKPVADSGALTDSVTPLLILTQRIDDGIAGTDSLVKGATKGVVDTAQGTDAQAKASTHALADAFAGTDALARVWAARVAVADNGNWTDAAQPVGPGGANDWTQTVDDSIAGTDAVLQSVVYLRAVSDAIAGSDAIDLTEGEVFELNWAPATEVNWPNLGP